MTAHDPDELAAANAYAASVQDYVASRLAVWAEHPDWTLGDVERNHFGAVDTDRPTPG